MEGSLLATFRLRVIANACKSAGLTESTSTTAFTVNGIPMES
jgi:hypothetical protein